MDAPPIGSLWEYQLIPDPDLGKLALVVAIEKEAEQVWHRQVKVLWVAGGKCVHYEIRYFHDDNVKRLA